MSHPCNSFLAAIMTWQLQLFYTLVSPAVWVACTWRQVNIPNLFPIPFSTLRIYLTQYRHSSSATLYISLALLRDCWCPPQSPDLLKPPVHHPHQKSITASMGSIKDRTELCLQRFQDIEKIIPENDGVSPDFELFHNEVIDEADDLRTIAKDIGALPDPKDGPLPPLEERLADHKSLADELLDVLEELHANLDWGKEILHLGIS